MSSLVLLSQDDIVITPVSFNSIESEYAPVYFQNGLVFTSVDRNNNGLTYLDYETGKQLGDLYYIPLSTDNSAKVKLFSRELKSSFHDGPITFSKDGLTAYFTRSQIVKKVIKNSIKNKNRIGLYKATFNGEVWTDIQPCFFNSEKYNTGQATLSADESRIYFVSDKEGGYGGLDLYYAEIVAGVCGAMVNLGKEINSSSNEMFPFIDQNNKLYFSSNRTGGYGGFDLYESDLLNNTWSTPDIMDSTVNSSFDDFSIMFNEDKTEGYFCSNKSGSDDIYKLEIIYPEFNECEELIDELLCYEFFEEATLNVDSFLMVYEWDFGDGVKEKSLETYHCYEKPGLYIVELNIMDPMVDAVFVNKAIYELEIEEVIQPEVIVPDTISTNTDFKVLVNQGNWKDYLISSYYIDYGDSTIIKNDKNNHKYSSSGSKELKVLISGYDEQTKEIKTNCFYKTIFVDLDSMLLASQNNILEGVKYEESNSNPSEELEGGVYVLEILRSSESVLGDSTVLKGYTGAVKEVYDTSSNQYSYVMGEETSPFKLLDDFRTAQKNGFDKAIVRFIKNGNIKNEDLIIVFDDESGEISVVLKKIQFEYNGYNLSSIAKTELEKLIQFLKEDKEINIEIEAHTDASRDIEKTKKLFAKKGREYTKIAHDEMSKAYNMKLSQKRAQSVMTYLKRNGVKKSRLKSTGYGETQPLELNYFPDGSDNPLGRAKNRRVSFRILAK